MATSSIYKNFVINTREEALGLLAMFEERFDGNHEEERHPLPPNVSMMTEEEEQELINEYLKNK